MLSYDFERYLSFFYKNQSTYKDIARLLQDLEEQANFMVDYVKMYAGYERDDILISPKSSVRSRDFILFSQLAEPKEFGKSLDKAKSVIDKIDNWLELKFFERHHILIYKANSMIDLFENTSFQLVTGDELEVEYNCHKLTKLEEIEQFKIKAQAKKYTMILRSIDLPKILQKIREGSKLPTRPF